MSFSKLSYLYSDFQKFSPMKKPSNPCNSLFLRFNPRAHEGRDLSCWGAWAAERCFNPHAHEGRD